VPQEQMGTAELSINSELVAKNPKIWSSRITINGLTAIQALENVGIKENDRILIHAGSGGVGSFNSVC
jgi:NADPH:quinone reductase-like Zn-dependent oxidoreductase